MIEVKDLLKIENSNLFLKFLHLFRDRKVSEESKLRLHYFIKDLEGGIENQKEKFMYYYNIMPGNCTAKSYTEIAREYKCSASNIRNAIIKYLILLKNKLTKEELKEFEKIIATTKYKNGRKINLKRIK